MALCSLQVFDKGVKVHFLAYSGTIHRSHLMQHSMKLEHDQEVRVLFPMYQIQVWSFDLHFGVYHVLTTCS